MICLKSILKKQVNRKKIYIGKTMFIDTFNINDKRTVRLFWLAGHEIYWWSDEKVEDIIYILERLRLAFDNNDEITNMHIGKKEFLIEKKNEIVRLYVFLSDKIGVEINENVVVDKNMLESAINAISILKG